MLNFTTLTGLTLAQLAAKLDEELPAEAYKPVPGGADLTDIDPSYMTMVLNQVFGLCSIGWGYRYDPAELDVSFGEKNALATLKSLTFWYALKDESGQAQTFEILSTGGSDNRTAAYAMKGAITSAIGHAASKIGFQQSVYLGKRDHRSVRSNGKKPAPPPAKAAPGPRPKPAPPAPSGNGAQASETLAPAATAEADPGERGLPSPRIAVPDQDGRAGDFVVEIGTANKGKKVRELTPEGVVWYATKMVASTPAASQLKAACEAYLAAHPEVREAGEKALAAKAKK